VRFVFDIAIAFLVAVVAGVWSAWLAVDQAPVFNPLRAAAWVAWPRLGSDDEDPYDLAASSRRPDLPLGSGEGLAFTAVADDMGAQLDGNCRYELAGETPAAELWTLAAYDSGGALMANPVDRYAVHSREILRRSDGSFVIAIGPDAAPGNWLPVARGSSFHLILRLYDTPLTSTARPTTITMPALRKVGCP
jgi:hypothetical protein